MGGTTHWVCWGAVVDATLKKIKNNFPLLVGEGRVRLRTEA